MRWRRWAVPREGDLKERLRFLKHGDCGKPLSASVGAVVGKPFELERGLGALPRTRSHSTQGAWHGSAGRGRAWRARRCKARRGMGRSRLRALRRAGRGDALSIQEWGEVRGYLEPGRGIEPLTCSLRVSRSAD
jgi:hypothetical protein